MRTRSHPLARLVLAVLVFASLSVPPAALAAPPKFPAPAEKPQVRPGAEAGSRPSIATDWRAPAVAGELLVVLDGTSLKASVSALKVSGATVEVAPSGSGALVVHVPDGIDRAVYARTAAAAPGVAWVQPNYLYHATVAPNDPRWSEQWGMARIGAASAWDVSPGTPAVTVAVVDTGVSLAHPDLAARVDTLNDYDFVNGDTTADDDEGHGTHVAGIVAATANDAIGVAGVAPECRILPVKVLDANGSGTSMGVAQGIRYAADRGAKVINLSLGGSYDDYTASAVEYAQSRGCIIVAATGNDGVSGADYPARLDGVVGVGAVDRQNRIADFSNYGAGTDIAAPGVGILSTLPGATWGELSGTSMATPHVAGAVALLAGIHSDWTANQIVNQLYSTTDDLGTSGHDSLFGNGLLRADRAMGGVAPAGDDEIPGVALPASPVAGALDRASDVDDVFSVLLGSGQTLNLTLNGASGTDFGLWLFGPDSASVADGTLAVAHSNSHAYPNSIAYTAPSTGVYYVNPSALAGAGSYTLTWSIVGTTDDNVPGIALASPPVNGSLDAATDLDDVYRVHLNPGEQLTVRMEGPETADFDMWLFGPSTLDVSSDIPLAKRNSSGSNELMRFVAPGGGDYYVDVWAYSGSGPYQLTWTVGPYVPDDNVPGVDLPASPVSAVVGGLTDTDDVYKVYVQAGQRLDLSLTGAAGTDHDLYVYGPTATDVDIDPAVARSRLISYPDEVSFVASETGNYYIDVYDPVMSGSYTLTWSLLIPPDDRIPGVPMPTSPAFGRLGVTTDTDDVYSVPLTAGQQVYFGLEGAEDTEFDLYLFGPGSTDARVDPVVGVADSGSYPRGILYTVPTTGTYYVIAHAYSGEGNYTLAWGYPSTGRISKTPSKSSYTLTRKKGKAVFSVGAKLVDFAGAPVNGAWIELQSSSDGANWSHLGWRRTGTTGKVSAKVTARKKGTYYVRWNFEGNERVLSLVSAKTKYKIK